jgi:6-phosphogluconate dehydrogenase
VTEVGVVDLGRVGAQIVRRLLAGGSRCVVWDRSPRIVAELAAEKAHGAASLADLALELETPRAVLIAGPAGTVDEILGGLLPHLAADDIVVNCADSDHVDDARRAGQLETLGIRYVDVGITGGMSYPDHGRCLTIGGDPATVTHLAPVFVQLAHGAGYVHCGPPGAGHFVNMMHQGIERAMLAMYAEAFSVLRAADVGGQRLDLAEIAKTWLHGSLVASPLLSLAARALATDAGLRNASAPSRLMHDEWAPVRAAAEEDVAVPVLASALYAAETRSDFSNRLLAAIERERANPRQAAGTA